MMLRSHVLVLAATLAVVMSWSNARAEQAAAADSKFDISAEIGTRWEDNIGLSESDQIIELTQQISTTVGYNLIRSRSAELSASITPFYNRVKDLSGLSNSGFTTGLEFRGEFGPEFTAPWYAVSVDYTVANFHDSRIRDGSWIEAELIAGKRFNPQFGFSGGLRLFERSQDNETRLCPTRNDIDCGGFWGEADVFEQERWGAFLHADWFANDKTSFFVEYSYWDGDEDATALLRFCVPTNPTPTPSPCIRNRRDTFSDDPAFSGTDRFIVWRVEAKQHVLEAGVRRAITDSIGFELVAAYMDTADVVSPDASRPNGQGAVFPDSIDQELGDYTNTTVMATFSFSLN